MWLTRKSTRTVCMKFPFQFTLHCTNHHIFIFVQASAIFYSGLWKTTREISCRSVRCDKAHQGLFLRTVIPGGGKWEAKQSIYNRWDAGPGWGFTVSRTLIIYAWTLWKITTVEWWREPETHWRVLTLFLVKEENGKKNDQLALGYGFSVFPLVFNFYSFFCLMAVFLFACFTEQGPFKHCP